MRRRRIGELDEQTLAFKFGILGMAHVLLEAGAALNIQPGQILANIGNTLSTGKMNDTTEALIKAAMGKYSTDSAVRAAARLDIQAGKDDMNNALSVRRNALDALVGGILSAKASQTSRIVGQSMTHAGPGELGAINFGVRP